MIWNKGVASVVVLALITLAFLTSCKSHYSMGKVESFEVNAPDLEEKVLIATQGSKYKDAVVAGLLDHLKQRGAYIKVIDVTELPRVNEDQWNAVVIIHTWQAFRPQADAKAYVDRAKHRRKVIVLTTSGSGDSKIAGVDAIASASVMADVPSRLAEIATRADAILGASRQK